MLVSQSCKLKVTSCCLKENLTTIRSSTTYSEINQPSLFEYWIFSAQNCHKQSFECQTSLGPVMDKCWQVVHPFNKYYVCHVCRQNLCEIIFISVVQTPDNRKNCDMEITFLKADFQRRKSTVVNCPFFSHMTK